MALALVLTTISPEVGGVLVRGEKGTAKSTIVRALAAVLPPIEVVAGDRFSSDPRDPAPLSPDGPFAGGRRDRDPPGAAGRAAGRRHRGPGARLAAPRARAVARARPSTSPACSPARTAGSCTSTRSTCSTTTSSTCCSTPPRWAARPSSATASRSTHAARFVLVGTMNPEEGELRPQLLDRFGLTVEVAAPRDPRAARRGGPPPDGLRRRPGRASPRGTPTHERALTDRIAGRADAASTEVELTDAALLKIAEVCAAFEVDGMRADIVTARAAVAHAAWHGRDRRSPATTSAPPPGSRSRTAAAATRSTRPASTRTCSTRSSATTSRRPSRPRAGAGRRRPDRTAPSDSDRATPDAPTRRTRTADADVRRPSKRPTTPEDRSRPTAERRGQRPADDVVGAGDAVPAQAVHGPRHRARATPGGAAGRSPSTGRRIGADADGRRRVARTWSRPSGPPRRTSAARGRTAGRLRFRGRRPAASRSARAGRPTWSCSASTPPARWPRASGWSRSRPRSCRCCSTPTSAATRSAWSPSAATRAELALPPTHSVEIAATPARATCPPAAARRWPRACSRPPACSASSASATRAAGRCSSSSPTAARPHGADAVAPLAAGRRAASPRAGVDRLVVDCETRRAFRLGLAARARRATCGAEHVPVAETSAAGSAHPDGRPHGRVA